jgi:nitroreductase
VIDEARLSMSVGEAIFTQRSIRRFRPDAIGVSDFELMLEAAVRAPNGGNHQTARFLLVTDPLRIRDFARLYHEAWWAKRWDEKRPWSTREDIPSTEKSYRAAAELADTIGGVPAIVLAFTVGPGGASSVLPACQNLMLAARALGIGSIPTTLHPSVMARVYALFGIPDELTFHFCIPLGYPAEGARFGGSRRRPTGETTYLDRWGAPVPWA